MKKENSFKRIIVVGNTSPTGYNARFVSSGGGVREHYAQEITKPHYW